MKKLQKSRKKMSDGRLSAATLAQRRRPVASGIALDPLRRSMRLVTYRRTDRASKTADKYGTWYCFVSFLWHSNPPSVRGNTARILARWRRTVASRETPKPLYRAISAVSRRSMNSSVETARTEVHSFVVDDRAIDLSLSY